MLVAFLGILDLGLSTTLNREIARYSAEGTEDALLRMRQLVATFGTVFWVVGAAAGGCLVFAAAPISRWFNVRDLPHETVVASLRLMGVVFALQWPFNAYLGGLYGLQRQVTVNVLQVSGAVVRSCGTAVVLLLFSRTNMAFFAWQAIAMSLQTFAAWWTVERCLPAARGRAGFRWGTLAANWKFSAGMTAVSLLALGLMQVDKVVVSRMLTLKDFGYYTLGWTAGGTLNNLVTPVVVAVFPALSQLVKKGNLAEIADFYHKSCQLMAVVLLPPALVLAVFSREAVFAWCGDVETTSATYRVVAWVATGTALNGLVSMPYFLQLAYGWTSLTVAVNALAIVVMFPAVYLLAHGYGPAGAASAWAILNAGYVLIVPPAMHRRVLKGETWRWYATDTGLPALGAALPVIALRLLAKPQSRIEAVTTVVVAGLLSATGSVLSAPSVRRRGLLLSRALLRPGPQPL
jgi:O-antigen/teichoic acid export membrane protein